MHFIVEQFCVTFIYNMPKKIGHTRMYNIQLFYSMIIWKSYICLKNYLDFFSFFNQIIVFDEQDNFPYFILSREYLTQSGIKYGDFSRFLFGS